MLEVFERTTTLAADPERPGTSRVNLDVAWSSLRGIHGGYLAALIVRATEPHLGGRDVRTLAVHFLRPAFPGEADLAVTEVRSGRSLGTFSVALTQQGKTIAVATVTGAERRDGEAWETPVDLDLPPLDACVPLVPPPGIGHFANGEARLDPRHLPFTHGPEARVGGYVRPIAPRPIDAAWLAMALDWFPPSPFTRNDPPVGGVSVDYAVHLHHTWPRLEPDEWLQGVFRADQSTSGLALERGRLASPTGRVLAESFHTRWTG